MCNCPVARPPCTPVHRPTVSIVHCLHSIISPPPEPPAPPPPPPPPPQFAWHDSESHAHPLTGWGGSEAWKADECWVLFSRDERKEIEQGRRQNGPRAKPQQTHSVRVVPTLDKAWVGPGCRTRTVQQPAQYLGTQLEATGRATNGSWRVSKDGWGGIHGGGRVTDSGWRSTFVKEEKRKERVQ